MKRDIARYFGDHKSHAGLGSALLRSGVIFVAARCINVIVQIGTTILLARLLGPHDFGLVAMVLALVGFAPFLIDLGTTDAVTQKTRITHDEISTLFWLNFSIGGIMTMLVAAGSSTIALIFGEPSLAGIALVSSLTFIMTALPMQHVALMRRAMEFRRIATIEIISNTASCAIALAMAFGEWGYWALVAKPILQLGIIAIGAWIYCPWLPGRARVSPEVRGMVRFGLGVAGFAISDQLTRSVDKLALAYLYGPTALGYFQNALLVYNNLISLFFEPLHNVAISGLSKLRDDVVELRRVWFATLSAVSFFTIPVFASLVVTGQDFLILLLGEKWAPAGPLLSIFAVRGIAQCVERTLGWLHVVAGRSDRWMRWGLFSTPCQLLALAVGLPFGPIGVAIAYTVAMFGLFIPAVVYSGAPVGIRVKDVLSATGPQVASGLIAATLGYMLQEHWLSDVSHLARFCISTPISLTIYLVAVVGLFRVSDPLAIPFGMLRGLIANASKRGP